MNTEVALILTVGGIVGSILVTQLWQLNWFKKENFKLSKSNIMAENRIKLKKLEKELGLDGSKGSSFDQKGGVLDLIKGLDRDKIEGLLDVLGDRGGGDYIDEEPSEIEKILKLVPPSVIDGFVKQLQKKGEGDQENLFNQ